MKRKALVFAVLSLAAGAAAAAAAVQPSHYRIVNALLERFDADGDRALDAAETARLEAHVARRYKGGGVVILRAVLAAADADRDGRITEAEWKALGERVAGRGGKARPRVRPRTYRVAMSDGARLATDVYLPAGKGPWPTVLMRTPYGKARSAALWPVEEGCAVVAQDMRGRFTSEGKDIPFVACGWGEHRDGADTVDWIRKQPWSDGKVATLGGSALGITQYLLAGAAPEGLVAQYISVAASSLYHHAGYVGGAFRKSQVAAWLGGNRFDPEAMATFRAHPTYDAYWRRLDATARAAEANCPAVHRGGWFDTFSLGTVEGWRTRQHRGGPGARGRQKLLMGPWTHGRGTGELTFPDSAAPAGYDASTWLGHWLRGADNGAAGLPPVAYYVLGDTSRPDAPGNEWRFADDWPLPHTPTTWHFRADGGLARARPDAGVRQYTFDPGDPCPTVGGCNLALPKGPRDQRRIEKRPDVLTFTTAPLPEPVEITGHGTARIFLASSAADTDLSVRLCDVYPSGASYLMAEGMLRLRFRGGFEKPRPLAPGEVVEVEVELWPVSLVLNRGHRLRIDVTSSNHPRFDVNPGTGRPHVPGGKIVRQTNRIHCGGQRPSGVILPVVRARRAG